MVTIFRVFFSEFVLELFECPSYILIIILIIYQNTKTEPLYPLKILKELYSQPPSVVNKAFLTYIIGLTKRSHLAPRMQHVTFCDSIVRFYSCHTNRIDSVCGVTCISLSAKDGSVISWGRGEGETSSCRPRVRWS